MHEKRKFKEPRVIKKSRSKKDGDEKESIRAALILPGEEEGVGGGECRRKDIMTFITRSERKKGIKELFPNGRKNNCGVSRVIF